MGWKLLNLGNVRSECLIKLSHKIYSWMNFCDARGGLTASAAASVNVRPAWHAIHTHHGTRRPCFQAQILWDPTPNASFRSCRQILIRPWHKFAHYRWNGRHSIVSLQIGLFENDPNGVKAKSYIINLYDMEAGIYYTTQDADNFEPRAEAQPVRSLIQLSSRKIGGRRRR